MIASASAAPAPVAGGWSSTVDGVRARLVVTPHLDAAKHAQITVAVELDNASDRGDPLLLAAGAPSQMVDLELTDAHGTALAQAAIPGSELTPMPFVLALPWRATLYWTLTTNAFEYVPSGRVLFRPFSLVAWDMPVGHGARYLRAKLHPVASNDVHGTWTGTLELPRVALP